jgi:hypothetical protein
LRQLLYFLGAVLLCWTVAAGADKSASPAAKGKASRQTYDLQYRPAVGMRWAYESSSDMELHFRAAATYGNRSAQTTSKSHTQVVVQSEEITEMTDGQSVARRVTFGPPCFTATQEDNKPTKKIRLVYAGKTVNFRLNPENDQIEQDYGVKPRPEEMRRLRNAMKGSAALFAGHPVVIGERWRADEGLRTQANLREGDTVSAIVTLKGVHAADDGEAKGRQVAELGVTAGVLTSEHGCHAEVSFEGNMTVDLASGQVIAMDLLGKMNLAAGGGNVSLLGDGKYEIHSRGRMLPPAGATPATQPATQPSNNLAATDTVK